MTANLLHSKDSRPILSIHCFWKRIGHLFREKMDHLEKDKTPIIQLVGMGGYSRHR